jgi:hypothetical protein
MKFKKIFFILILLAVFSLGATSVLAIAADTSGGAPVPDTSGGAPAKPPVKVIPSLQNPLQVNNVQELLAKVVDYAIFLGLIFATLMFVFIGFKFIMAQGDSKAISEARSWFLWAVIGTALLISARIIVDVVKNTSISAGLVDPKVFNKP